MKINFTKCLFVGFLLLIQTNIILSQIEIKYDSKGTDFWLTFLPNFHNDPNTDSLYIFITSSEPTSGTIEYSNRMGNTFTQSFTISDPTQIYVFKLKSYNFELLGFNEGGIIRSSNQGESIASNSFHITSEKEITVYALNQAHYTSDAFMVLPTDVLDKRYFILSYNSDYARYAVYVDYSRRSQTPSQFAIVATEDSTLVTIYPSAETFVNGLNIQAIRMNRGDVYFVQAMVSDDNPDLTGTEIISSKPIAVFSGHQRATVPVTLNAYNPSRDILVEQLPPVSTWGKNAIVVPLATSRNEMPLGNNLFRVLAAEDQTEVYIDGVKITTLNSGGYYEGVLNKAMFITASKPILVGAFKKTVGYDGRINTGDPFFLVMPPIEQYMNNYRVINAQVYERGQFSNYYPVYLEQYISIIIPKSHWQSFRLDGSPLLPGNIVNMNSVDYVYATIRVTDGVHYAEADTTFGIIIYGYGEANSYGYIGGSSYINLKYFEPKVKTLETDSCFISKGIAYKYGARDADLVDIFVIDSVTRNVELYNKTYSKDTIFYSFKLKDIYNDGSYGLFVVDTIGLKSPLFVEWVPGFTICSDGYRNTTSIPVIKDTTSVGKDICFAVNLENYGRFEQTITSAYLKNLGITLGNITSFNVQPLSKYQLTFCLNFNRDTTIIDTLIIENKCAKREIMALEILILADRNQPKISSEKDTCLKYIDWVITDSLKFDKGLLRVDVLEKTNCRIDLVAFFPKKVIARVEVINPFEDTFYNIVAEDSVGNSIEINDTIPGFTLQILDFDNERTYDFSSLSVGYVVCDTLWLYNYGNFTIRLDDVEFGRNIEFSIPPSQLPIVIPPKTSAPLYFCFNPSKTGPVSDTLKYMFRCSSIQLPVQGEGKVISLSGNTNCNVQLITKLQGVKNVVISDESFPNPAKTIVYLPIPKGIEAPVTIELFNSIGNKISSTIIPTYDSEASFVEIDISLLSNGFYIASLKGRDTVYKYKFFKLY